jgi:hypothetical protein
MEQTQAAWGSQHLPWGPPHSPTMSAAKGSLRQKGATSINVAAGKPLGAAPAERTGHEPVLLLSFPGSLRILRSSSMRTPATKASGWPSMTWCLASGTFEDRRSRSHQGRHVGRRFTRDERALFSKNEGGAQPTACRYSRMGSPNRREPMATLSNFQTGPSRCAVTNASRRRSSGRAVVNQQTTVDRAMTTLVLSCMTGLALLSTRKLPKPPRILSPFRRLWRNWTK